MNVLYAADVGYAEIVAVSLLSLLDSNREVKELNIYIVEDKITAENQQKLKTICADYNRNVVFLSKPDIRGILGVELKTLRWSDSAYSRLFLKELFAPYPDVDKILYLDCDTLVVDTLQELWDTDITGYLGAACLECMSNVHKRIIGRPRTSNYLNSGMMLVDVKRWNAENIQAAACEFLKRYKGKTEYVDQGVINGTIGDRFLLVSPRYNLTALAYDFTYEEMLIYRKPQFSYSKQEWEEAVAHPAVIHFTTSFLSIRPWFAGSRHPYAKRWSECHARTPWKDSPPREMPGRTMHERHVRLYHALPRWLAVRIAGFLHAYVKPIAYLLM